MTINRIKKNEFKGIPVAKTKEKESQSKNYEHRDRPSEFAYAFGGVLAEFLERWLDAAGIGWHR
jgi:hypothetical protein